MLLLHLYEVIFSRAAITALSFPLFLRILTELKQSVRNRYFLRLQKFSAETETISFGEKKVR